MVRRKREDKSRLMLLITVFLLGYIFFAGGGFSKTGQLTREAYMIQQRSLDVNPHNIGAVKGPRQNPIYSPDVIPGGSPSGSGSSQYISYGPYCGCSPTFTYLKNGIWVVAQLAPQQSQEKGCTATNHCNGICMYGNNVVGYVPGEKCRDGGASTDVVTLF